MKKKNLLNYIDRDLKIYMFVTAPPQTVDFISFEWNETNMRGHGRDVII